jgi:predicted RNase H-like nuclease (RuvC/YqgF family)
LLAPWLRVPCQFVSEVPSGSKKDADAERIGELEDVVHASGEAYESLERDHDELQEEVCGLKRDNNELREEVCRLRRRVTEMEK